MSAASVSVPLTHKDIALLCMGLAYLASDSAVFPEARELLYRLEAAAKPFGPMTGSKLEEEFVQAGAAAQAAVDRLIDPELRSIATVLEALRRLDQAGRLRVLRTVAARLELDAPCSIESLALDAGRLFADCTCDGNSECEHCLELRRQQAIAAGKLQACDCGRDAQGGPYPRVHAPGCAYIGGR